jgi:carbon-monoxide dehydrogenase medium subunit
MYAFDYKRAGTVAEAANLASTDTEARIIAGGQTLIPTLKQRLAKPSMLIDIGGIGELKAIDRDGNTLRIGAMATHAEIAGSKVVQETIPALAHLAEGIGDAQVRHRGTIGGSVANNDPAADWPAAVLGLGATVMTSKRTIKAEDFFSGFFTTALEPGEIVTAIAFPVPEKAGYAKLAQPASRFALVGVFVSKIGSAVRVAVTGAGESGVFRQGNFETALAKDFSVAALNGLAAQARWLISDLHAPAEYRAAVIPVITERAMAMAIG